MQGNEPASFDASGQYIRAARRARVRPTPDGHGAFILSLPDIRCGGCVAGIERALNNCSGVLSARVNLTLRRVNVTLTEADTDPLPVIETLAELGYAAAPIDGGEADDRADHRTGHGLLQAMAVAGFGAANIMLLSVAVWSGADGATRGAFHLISALIALPVVAYAGQPFFRSAAAALRAGRLNMDVPIALAVLLALVLSLYETARGGEQVFFDAAVTLLFFLLIGRYLDQLMRDRARSAVTGLARLTPHGAMVRQADGSLDYEILDAIAPNMVLHIAPGERVPLDVRITEGATDIDRSVVTGEAMPVSAGQGAILEAGTLNLTGGIEAVVLRPADDSFLARMVQMLTAAETGRGAYVRIADRAARLYAPIVHLLALATFLGWMAATGGDWRTSVFVAISVLVITCPCALGLAVPVTHVIAAGRLMREGILMKDGSALERLAEIDCAVFDKTGTLTTGTPMVTGAPLDRADRSGAKALALHSMHPAAVAIARHVSDRAVEVKDPQEVPGFGVEGLVDGKRARLGRADWVAEIAGEGRDIASPAFAFAGGRASSFDLSETLRLGAGEAIAGFRKAGIMVAMLSGDAADRAARLAGELGIAEVRSEVTPAGKIAYLDALRAEGHRALMIGDGLNDTAALVAAHVSMTPASAADAGRTAADFVFLRDSLDAVPLTHAIARRVERLVRQNFGLAIAYNCVAIPLAVAGFVTPLVAALAMSASSMLVIGNSLRLNRSVTADKRVTAAATALTAAEAAA